MKRVVTKITQSGGRWDFSVSVDGEEFAAGTAPDYLWAAKSAQGYVLSLANEASAGEGPASVNPLRPTSEEAAEILAAARERFDADFGETLTVADPPKAGKARTGSGNG